MTKLIAALSLGTFMVLSTSGTAFAFPDFFGFPTPPREPPSGLHESSPEPVTIIGLALGAGALVGGRIIARRKAQSKA
jgi:hypothetical protein